MEFDPMNSTQNCGTHSGRDAERSIPAVAVPSLAELGLNHLSSISLRTKLVFVGRPVIAAGFMATALATGRPLLALALIPGLYATSLTLVHHCVHGSLRLVNWLRHLSLFVGGALALGSGHALVITHTNHHQTSLDLDDPEGFIETVAWKRLPVEAVLFRYRLWAWRQNSQRGTIAAEIAVHISALASAPIVWLATSSWHWPLVVIVMWGSDVVFAVLAGKGPQTNWGRPISTPLVIIRCRLTRRLLISHNWHLEHHLYPQLPLFRLGQVVDQLDALGGIAAVVGQPTITIQLP
jgi:beta-carotene hydroxylase